MTRDLVFDRPFFAALLAGAFDDFAAGRLERDDLLFEELFFDAFPPRAAAFFDGAAFLALGREALRDPPDLRDDFDDFLLEDFFEDFFEDFLLEDFDDFRADLPEDFFDFDEPFFDAAMRCLLFVQIGSGEPELELSDRDCVAIPLHESM